MVCSKCMEMFGTGVQIGMKAILPELLPTLRHSLQGNIECYVVEVGVILHDLRHFVMQYLQIVVLVMSEFVLCLISEQNLNYKIL